MAPSLIDKCLAIRFFAKKWHKEGRGNGGRILIIAKNAFTLERQNGFY